MQELEDLAGADAARIDALVATWRADRSLDQRIMLAGMLWNSALPPARHAAAKLLTQARMRPDDAAWDLIAGWAPDLDDRRSADLAMTAGQKRLIADPARIETVAGWTEHPNPLTRRAALMVTLPWAKMPHPGPDDVLIRNRVLGWAETMAGDRSHAVQTAIGAWLRALAKRDAPRVRVYMSDHGARLVPPVRAEIADAVQDR